jgi:hypothetical protein
MRYAIWISTPSAADAKAIAGVAPEVASNEFDFAVRERGAPEGPAPAVDLAFHVDSDGGADEAKARALKAYECCRAAAGLGVDEAPPARIALWPAQG